MFHVNQPSTGPSGILYRREQRQAIRRAYARFARLHPDCAVCLFDETFVLRVVPTLLEGQRTITPQTLAVAWSEQLHYADETLRRQHIAELAQAAADFVDALAQEQSHQAGTTPSGRRVFSPIGH